MASRQRRGGYQPGATPRGRCSDPLPPWRGGGVSAPFQGASKPWLWTPGRCPGL